MVARTQKEIRQRAPLWFAALVIFNFLLMTWSGWNKLTRQNWFSASVQTVAALVQRPVAGAGDAGINFVRRFAELRHAESENEQLKERVSKLEADLRESQNAREENERLKGLLGLKEESKYGVIPARVIARDPTAWFDSVTINRGRAEGVQVGMPVVTREGIVGRVVGTSLLSSQVMLITDKRAAAGAAIGQLSTSNALGSIQGNGASGALEMLHVSGLEQVKVGDHVVTTGQDGIYPPNLNIGDVAEIKEGTATVPHQIYIKPSAHLGALSEVAVLQYKPAPRQAPDQTLPNVDKGKK